MLIAVCAAYLLLLNSRLQQVFDHQNMIFPLQIIAFVIQKSRPIFDIHLCALGILLTLVVDSTFLYIKNASISCPMRHDAQQDH